MIQEILNQTESPGNASWTSSKMLLLIAIVAMFGLGFVVLLAVLAPQVVKTLGLALVGLGGFLLGVIAIIVLLYNFFKMLREIGVLG